MWVVTPARFSPLSWLLGATSGASGRATPGVTNAELFEVFAKDKAMAPRLYARKAPGTHPAANGADRNGEILSDRGQPDELAGHDESNGYQPATRVSCR